MKISEMREKYASIMSSVVSLLSLILVGMPLKYYCEAN